MASSRFTELAASIAQNTSILQGFYNSNGVSAPSIDDFDPRAAGRVSELLSKDEEAFAAQRELAASTLELHNLVKGPGEMLMGLTLIAANDLLALRVLSHFELAKKVPMNDVGITFKELAEQCNIAEQYLRRFMQQLMTVHIFRERDGNILHTAASKLLSMMPPMNQFVGLITDEYASSASKTIESIENNSIIREPEKTGFSLANHVDQGLYSFMQANEEPRGKRFAGAMTAFASRFTIEPRDTLFDWGACKQVVDVGGGQGPLSIGLAEKFPHVEFVVQDLPGAISSALEVKEELKVTFEEGDFLEVQPRKGADVYLMRAILSNWTDEFALKILKNQVPALVPGARILIEEMLPPPSDLHGYPVKMARSLDLTMLTWFGGRYRTINEMKSLVSKVGPGLKWKQDSLIPPSHCLIELVWDP